jgi:hypothetical protein
MPDPATLDARLARLADVSPRPVSYASHLPLLERRNRSQRAALQRRICNEFVEMPGTSLTVAQGARLFGVHSEICGRIFAELVRDGKLKYSRDARYRSRSAA